MTTQHELGFRMLQGGQNTGKIVVRISAAAPDGGVHVITGGTGGLGILTSRWLMRRGASQLVLASRSGEVREQNLEWDALKASDVPVSLERCDMTHAAHVHRLLAPLTPRFNVWHAAGYWRTARFGLRMRPALS